MTDKVQKIREEVERLKSNLVHGACASQIAMETRCKEEAYDEVISLLDSLQEEPVSEDLEKAAWSYTNNIDNIGGSVGEQTRNAFKAGTRWQKKQMVKMLLKHFEPLEP